MKEYLYEQLEMAVEEILEDAYNHELNFNNADVTSGQRCYDEQEIEKLTYEVLEVLLRGGVL